MAESTGNARAALSEEKLKQLEATELQEWLDSLDYVLESGGDDRALQIIQRLRDHAAQLGAQVRHPKSPNTPVTWKSNAASATCSAGTAWQW